VFWIEAYRATQQGFGFLVLAQFLQQQAGIRQQIGIVVPVLERLASSNQRFIETPLFLQRHGQIVVCIAQTLVMLGHGAFQFATRQSVLDQFSCADGIASLQRGRTRQMQSIEVIGLLLKHLQIYARGLIEAAGSVRLSACWMSL
jgi:hypothetical protein